MNNLTDHQLITIEQALRLSRHSAEKLNHQYTLAKIAEALSVVQSIPHSSECWCDYCQERHEAQNTL